ncbi:MAG: peptide chain release factor 1 [Deltaproteobacteria bacterium]|jgi:peptide chain release factor 1|nr:peptide chain release factor 1 [Deltaproteobacteria bacterium]MBT6500718.1 peptide chain release factor 1 [Deltaproteobacteria bacterium]
MLDKLAKIADRFEEITALLSQPEIISDSKRFQSLSKEQAKMASLVDVFQSLTEKHQELEGNIQMSKDPEEDPEMRDMAKEEVLRLKKEISQFQEEAKILLMPKDPDDEKNTILEIRAGTGGDEAALFVADLYRMYLKFAEQKKWRVDVMNSSSTGIGGFKEIVISIEGKSVYSRLKFEAGTHRVQRVPKTETQGRVHTSAVTVAVLPEAEDVDVEVNVNDLRIDTYRSQGAGGQHVNTSDSAIRITHNPTGIVVTCQEERSQLKNKNKAMKHLKAKLYEVQLDAVTTEAAEMRKNMVGSGDRSERIRTYNYPQGRITDHRIGLTLYKLEEMMSSGDLDEVVDALTTNHQAELLDQQDKM